MIDGLNYAEVTGDEQLANWIGAHVRAFDTSDRLRLDLDRLADGLNAGNGLRLDPDRLTACAIHHHNVTAWNNVGDPVFAAVIGRRSPALHEAWLTALEPRHPETHHRAIQGIAVLIEHDARYRPERSHAEDEALTGLARVKRDHAWSMLGRGRAVPGLLVAVMLRV